MNFPDSPTTFADKRSRNLVFSQFLSLRIHGTYDDRSRFPRLLEYGFASQPRKPTTIEREAQLSLSRAIFPREFPPMILNVDASILKCNRGLVLYLTELATSMHIHWYVRCRYPLHFQFVVGRFQISRLLRTKNFGETWQHLVVPNMKTCKHTYAPFSYE